MSGDMRHGPFLVWRSTFALAAEPGPWMVRRDGWAGFPLLDGDATALIVAAMATLADPAALIVIPTAALLAALADHCPSVGELDSGAAAVWCACAWGGDAVAVASWQPQAVAGWARHFVDALRAAPAAVAADPR